MQQSTCPACGCEKFYVKHPEDEYDIYEFECRDGEIRFDPGVDPGQCPPIEEGTRTYCCACSWHDAFRTLR